MFMKDRRNKLHSGIVFLLLIAGMLCGQAMAGAQASATASANANIIVPITMSLVSNMNFGNVAVSASSGGTVVLSSGSTRTSTSGVTLPATAGTVAAASFTVTGAPSYTYSVSLPAAALLSDGSSHSMTISSFTSAPSGAGVLSSGGSQTLTVGATLSVTASQAPGAYTNSAAVPVVVNYN
jgi:Domain of unknown function (DUF4402)